MPRLKRAAAETGYTPIMDSDWFRRLADRCRALMEMARTEGAREQLAVWAAEFEAVAKSLKQENIGNRTERRR
jgi:hypothetical protein